VPTVPLCRFCIPMAAALCLLGSLTATAKPRGAVCMVGADGTLGSTLFFFQSNVRTFASPEVKTRVVQSESLRALLAIENCPATAEEFFSGNRETAQSWIAALPTILQPYVPGRLTPDIVSTIIQRVPCSRGTPLLCSLREELKKLAAEASGRNPPPPAAGHPCTDLAPLILENALPYFSEDLRDLAFDLTRDLAFIGAVCPDQLFGFMHTHPEDFDLWLGWLEGAIFDVDPSAVPLVKEYRLALIAAVKRSTRSNEYEAEKRRALDRLGNTPVVPIN